MGFRRIGVDAMPGAARDDRIENSRGKAGLGCAIGDRADAAGVKHGIDGYDTRRVFVEDSERKR